MEPDSIIQNNVINTSPGFGHRTASAFHRSQVLELVIEQWNADRYIGLGKSHLKILRGFC